MASNATALRIDRRAWVGSLLLVTLALVVMWRGPGALFGAVVVSGGLAVIALRPEWGVAVLLITLLVQYGQGGQRELWGLARVLPSGFGYLTINNMLGLYLGLMMIYRIYRDGDWSFLKNRQLHFIFLIAALFGFSSFINPFDPQELISLGLRPPSQDPLRVIITRSLFVLLLVYFIRQPRDVRMIVGIFIALALGAALGGATQAFSGVAYKERFPGFRAGGPDVLIASAMNPNRLALVCTLAAVFIWEYTEYGRHQRWRWLTGGGILVCVVTVFLTASRGGVIGLMAAAVLVMIRRRQRPSALFYGLIVAGLAWMLVLELVPAPNWERLSEIPGVGEQEGERSGSLLRRQYTLIVVLRAAAERPVLGVGLGNWDRTRFEMDPTRSTAPPHNSYLLALVEGGVVTLICYLALFALTIRQLGAIESDPETMDRVRADGLEWVVRATRVSVLSFMFFSLFADLWELMFFYLLIGLAAVLIQRYRPDIPPRLAPA